MSSSRNKYTYKLNYQIKLDLIHVSEKCFFGPSELKTEDLEFYEYLIPKLERKSRNTFEFQSERE